jgi:hypothetical protein
MGISSVRSNLTDPTLLESNDKSFKDETLELKDFYASNNESARQPVIKSHSISIRMALVTTTALIALGALVYAASNSKCCTKPEQKPLDDDSTKEYREVRPQTYENYLNSIRETPVSFTNSTLGPQIPGFQFVPPRTNVPQIEDPIVKKVPAETKIQPVINGNNTLTDSSNTIAWVGITTLLVGITLSTGYGIYVCRNRADQAARELELANQATREPKPLPSDTGAGMPYQTQAGNLGTESSTREPKPLPSDTGAEMPDSTQGSWVMVDKPITPKEEAEFSAKAKNFERIERMQNGKEAV